MQKSKFKSLENRTEDYQENLKKINNHLVSIIIPMYNEEHSIRNVISRIPNSFKCEIIIVDDGSTDNSLKELYKIKNRKTRIIRHKENRGYGAAIMTGIRYAKGDIMVTMDSDGQHNPEEILNLIIPILQKTADFVVGSRYIGNSNYKVPLHTRIGEIFINLFLKVLYNQDIGNNQSGFRAFSQKSLNLFDNMIFSRFGLCTEMLFKIAYNRSKIIEVPITMNKREYGTSYNQVLKILKSVLSCLFLYSLKRCRVGIILPKRIYKLISKKFVRYLRKNF